MGEKAFSTLYELLQMTVHFLSLLDIFVLYVTKILSMRQRRYIPATSDKAVSHHQDTKDNLPGDAGRAHTRSKAHYWGLSKLSACTQGVGKLRCERSTLSEPLLDPNTSSLHTGCS
jgi:hypothetical protein